MNCYDSIDWRASRNGSSAPAGFSINLGGRVIHVDFASFAVMHNNYNGERNFNLPFNMPTENATYIYDKRAKLKLMSNRVYQFNLWETNSGSSYTIGTDLEYFKRYIWRP